jgi:hypothetical protein
LPTPRKCEVHSDIDLIKILLFRRGYRNVLEINPSSNANGLDFNLPSIAG